MGGRTLGERIIYSIYSPAGSTVRDIPSWITGKLVVARLLTAWKDRDASEHGNCFGLVQTRRHRVYPRLSQNTWWAQESQVVKKKVMKQIATAWWQQSFSVCLVLPSLRAVSGIDFLWLFTVLLDHLGKVKTPQNSPFLSSQLLLGDLAQQFLGKEVLILHEKAHRRPWGFREILQATTCETEVDFLFTSHPWSPFFNPSQGSSVKEQKKSIN